MRRAGERRRLRRVVRHADATQRDPAGGRGVVLVAPEVLRLLVGRSEGLPVLPDLRPPLDDLLHVLHLVVRHLNHDFLHHRLVLLAYGLDGLDLDDLRGGLHVQRLRHLDDLFDSRGLEVRDGHVYVLHLRQNHLCPRVCVLCHWCFHRTLLTQRVRHLDDALPGLELYSGDVLRDLSVLRPEDLLDRGHEQGLRHLDGPLLAQDGRLLDDFL
mmetsp:Transcript_95133/g.269296  ORF Transcript_95133/g.269296 Transcript_95133/m.269296 type:complete len:213 (-) Transcript_95133:1023-1661(-)